MFDDTNTPYESIVSLGETFAKYRRSLRISQQRLHEKTGISIFTISQFENGRGHGLSLSHFLLLMEAVGLEIALSDLIPLASEVDPEKVWRSQNKKGGKK
ncbi:MAG: helix-turn-helix domain-containing protein [Odoribacter sp.]|nr:helix-turn-helix domain-containing protein [Odoribacter sp.]